MASQRLLDVWILDGNTVYNDTRALTVAMILSGSLS